MTHSIWTILQNTNFILASKAGCLADRLPAPDRTFDKALAMDECIGVLKLHYLGTQIAKYSVGHGWLRPKHNIILAVAVEGVRYRQEKKLQTSLIISKSESSSGEDSLR